MEMTRAERALWDRAFKEGYAAAQSDATAPQPLFEGTARDFLRQGMPSWQLSQRIVVYPADAVAGSATPTFCEPDEDMRRVMQAMQDEPGSTLADLDDELYMGAGSATPTGDDDE